MEEFYVGKKYSIFNNFNKNYNNHGKSNYYNEYVDEFSEELFNRDKYGGIDGIASSKFEESNLKEKTTVTNESLDKTARDESN
jgi:hypothetical protein